MTAYSEFSKEIIIFTAEVLLSSSQLDLSYSSVLDECVAVCMCTKVSNMHAFHCLILSLHHQQKIKAILPYIWKSYAHMRTYRHRHVTCSWMNIHSFCVSWL